MLPALLDAAQNRRTVRRRAGCRAAAARRWNLSPTPGRCRPPPSRACRPAPTRRPRRRDGRRCALTGAAPQDRPNGRQKDDQHPYGPPGDFLTKLAGQSQRPERSELLFPWGARGVPCQDSLMADLDAMVWAPCPGRQAPRLPDLAAAGLRGPAAGLASRAAGSVPRGWSRHRPRRAHAVRDRADDADGQAVRLAGGRRADRPASTQRSPNCAPSSLCCAGSTKSSPGSTPTGQPAGWPSSTPSARLACGTSGCWSARPTRTSSASSRRCWWVGRPERRIRTGCAVPSVRATWPTRWRRRRDAGR